MEYWMKIGISIMMIFVLSASYSTTGAANVGFSCPRDLQIDGTLCDENRKCPVNDSCDDPSQCPCMDGYKSHNITTGNRNQTECDDIQECFDKVHACGANSDCRNIIGGYFCICDKGFRRGNVTEFCPTGNRTENTCLDIDECKENPDICGPNSDCENTIGSYQCVCSKGFKNISNNCTDVDECKENPDICGPNSICMNTNGSYHCVCMEGFKNISNRCTVTRCKGNPGICGLKGICVSKQDVITCICQDGYKAVSLGLQYPQCNDINECKENPIICGPYGDCENTNGSYECVCIEGFTRISKQCTECKTNGMEREYLEHCTTPTTQDSFCSVLEVSFGFLNDSCEIPRNYPTEKAKEELEQAAGKLSQALANNSGNVQRSTFITAFLYSVERVVLISFLEAPRVQHINTAQLDITMKPSYDICSHGVRTFSLVSADNIMEVPCRLVEGEKGGAILIIYKEFNFPFNGNILLKSQVPGQDNRAVINSKVVTGAITNPDSQSLSSPVTFRLFHLQPVKLFNKVICVFWDPVWNGWSDEGCETGQSDGTHTNCSCTHLSSFALLMAHHGIQFVQEYSALTILSYIGLSISVVCLCLSLLTFMLCRSLKNAHSSVLTALCGCLFLGQLLFLVGIGQTWNKLLCAFIAGLLQFFFLCAFGWMSIESVLLFMTVRNLRAVNYMASQKSNFPKLCLLGFGIPAVIVGISAAVHPHGYGMETSCWLSHDIIWSFLGPVCASIIITTILLVLTFWLLKKRMASLNANVSTLKNTRLLTFKAMAQFFILGCTWGIGYFQIGPQSLVVSYLFTIFNSIQGLYIFLVYCLLNQQVREEYRKLFYGLCKQKKQKQDTSTMSTLQTASKPLTSTTDCHSTCAPASSKDFNKDVTSTDHLPAEEKEQSV